MPRSFDLMREKVICVFVDALRPDFIGNETPFSQQFLNEHSHIKIDTILGYSNVIDATIFMGAYPDVHAYRMKYCYDSLNSPFKSPILRPLIIVDHIPSPFIRSGINYALYRGCSDKVITASSDS